ncbi:MAG: DUF6464 family protein [Actinomycetota bacterium]
MLEAIFVFLLGLTPSLLSLWLMRKAERRARERLRAARASVAARNWSTEWLLPERQYVEGVGYLVGDITCQFNARSAYIRCAVNPYGPCQDCPYYEPRAIEPECQKL